MYMNLEHRLQYIGDMAPTGTLAVVDGELDFRKTDAFIQFLKLALDQIPNAYGTQNPEWQKRIARVRKAAERLQTAYTWFAGDTPEEFKEHCGRVSGIMDEEVKPLECIPLDIHTECDTLQVIKAHVAKGHDIGFYYPSGVNYSKFLIKDLADQLSRMKFSKLSCRNYDVSNFCTSFGYHEHVHDALNLLMALGVYIINCSSTREKDCYSFDTQRVHNDLRYAQSIIERIEFVN